MNYIYIDGDNIGLTIEQSFLNNDESELILINNRVIKAITSITDFLISTEHTIIFSGADGIICKSENLILDNILRITRTADSKITFSIGVGKTLQDCYLALRYAKSYSKDVAVTLRAKKFVITA